MYEHTDFIIDKLNKKYIRRFGKLRSLLNIDEVNPLDAVVDAYDEMEQEARKEYVKLAKRSYADGCREIGKDNDGFIDYLWCWRLLEWYDPVTKYSFENEVFRKSRRLAEAILSGANKREECKKALRYWTIQSTQYAINMTDEARLEAFKRGGIRKVKWVTRNDEKRCAICQERDGKVYDIMRVPPKPHFNCRCWLEPIIER